MKKILFIITIIILGGLCGLLGAFVPNDLSMIFSFGAFILPMGLYLNFKDKF